MKKYEQLKIEAVEMLEAAKCAGYRERYAIEHGNRKTAWINNHKCYVFEYSEKLEYQDANGAIYDTVRKTWIG